MTPAVEAMIYVPFAPTAPLEEFAEAYAEDDNLWWRIACGHHMNLMDEALDRLGLR